MARKKQKKIPSEPAKPKRSTLHEVLTGRKAAPHRPDSQKKVTQKLRREIEEQG